MLTHDSTKQFAKLIIPFVSLILLMIIGTGYAKTHDVYTFENTTQQTEFDDILKNLRCLVCQNQDLSDSHAQFSTDLRTQIHQWIIDGKSEQDIIHTLTHQYGDFILFQPPVKKTTYILWYGPFMIFFIAIIILCVTVYYRYKVKIK